MRSSRGPAAPFRAVLLTLVLGGTLPIVAQAATATEVWQTRGSVTFASADGGEMWLIDASGGLESPKADLLRIGAHGASRVTTFRGHAFSPIADPNFVFVVVDNDIVRVDKRAPHATKILKKGELWPIGTAVDKDFIYFTNQSTEYLDGGPRDGKPGSISKMKKNGDDLQRLASADARNLVIDEKNVYFSNGTSVCAVSKSGGRVRTLVEETGQLPFLAIDGEWLVYTRSEGVSRVNTKSGRIESLVDDIDIPLFVAATGGVTYVGANLAFQGPGEAAKPAEVLRLRAGHAPERLWSGMNRLTTMVLANGALYFTIERVDGVAGATVLRLDTESDPKPMR